MGNTVSESDSRRITMGMLVTGSIISPRIFISTSIVVPSRLFAYLSTCDASARLEVGLFVIKTSGDTDQ
jgi:hypothetical protein